MFNAGAVVGRMVLDTRGYVRGAGQVEGVNARMRRSMHGVTGQGLALAATLGVIGAAATKATIGILKAASDAEETANLFRITMGGMAEDGEKWANMFSDSIGGLNVVRIERMLGVFMNMTETMGLTSKAAFGMSKQLTQLTYDMASFFNLNIDEAFLKIQSGLAGEIEPLRRLGIVVSEEATKRKAFSLGLIRTMNEEMTETEKVYARYRLIVDQTTKVQGDLFRTQDQLANQWRILTERVETLSAQMGKLIATEAQGLIDKANNVVSIFSKWADENKRLTAEILLLGAGIGVAAIGLSAMLLMIPPLVQGFALVFSTISLIISPTGVVLGLLVAIGAAGLYIVELYRSNFMGVKKDVDQFAGSLGKIHKALDGITGVKFVDFFLTRGPFVVGVKLVLEALEAIRAGFLALNAAARTFFRTWDGSISGLGSALKAAAGMFSSEFNNLLKQDVVEKLFVGLTTLAKNKMRKAGGETGQIYIDSFAESAFSQTLAGKIAKQWEAVSESLPTVFKQFGIDSSLVLDNLKEKLNEISGGRFEKIQELAERLVTSLGNAADEAGRVELPLSMTAEFEASARAAEEFAANVGKFKGAGIDNIVIIKQQIEALQDLYSVMMENEAFFDENSFGQIDRAIQEATDQLEGFTQAGIDTTEMLKLQEAELIRLREAAERLHDAVAVEQINEELNQVRDKLDAPTGNGLERSIHGVRTAVRDLAREWTNLSSQFGSATKDIASAFTSNMTDGIMDYIQGVKTAKQAFEDFAKATILSIIRIGIQMAIQYALGQLFMALLGGTMTAFAKTMAAAWAPAAIAASIATLGGAAASGLASFAGAIAGGIGIATGASAIGGGVGGAGTPGFARGIEDVPYNGFYRLHAGEQVVPRAEAYDQKNKNSQPFEIVIVNTLNAASIVAAGMSSNENRKIIPNVLDAQSAKTSRGRRFRL